MPKSKRMRLPNGFGQISEIKNARLRKPFRAMATVGKREDGKPICKLIKPVAYFATYHEAYAALIEYNKTPYDVLKDSPVTEVFDKWYEEKCQTVTSRSVKDDIKRTWRYCSAVYGMPIRDIKAWHIKDCMDNGEAEIWGKPQKTTDITKRKIKTLFNQLFDYAMQYDLVDRNYARNLMLPKAITQNIENVRKEHISFTDEEMAKLWADTRDTSVQMLLVQCYSGWRPKELLELKISDVDLEMRTFKGGMKTEAGKDRVVPIHSAVFQFVIYNYDFAVAHKSKWLFNCREYRTNKVIPVNYHKYSGEISRIIAERGLNPEHRPHDARKQFVTLAKKYNVDEYAIKRMVGHTIRDITEKVYTDRDDNWLRTEIEKIKVDVGIV